jgi:hypothetical protein
MHGDTVLPSSFRPFSTSMIARLGGGVDAGEGLVEQVEVGILRQRPGEEHALLLAARQLADLAVGEIGHADPVEAGLAPDPDAPDSARTARARGRDPSAPRRSRGREIPVDAGPLRHVGDRARALAAAGRRSTSPDSGGTTPSAAFRSVDLPAPFGPMMAVMAPAGRRSRRRRTPPASRHRRRSARARQRQRRGKPAGHRGSVGVR